MTNEGLIPDTNEERCIPSCGDSANNEKRKLFQYAVNGNEYIPAGKTTKELPAGVFDIHINHNGEWVFKEQHLNIYDLIRFDNSISDEIIAEFEKFWLRKDEYDKRSEPHKRGYLLCGPPGGGKTCVIRQMMDAFVKQGNVVFLLSQGVPIEGIQAFKEIENDRKIMIIVEDIDALLKYNEHEQSLLQLLDGGIQHSNTVIVTTTNYPEKLPDRIINRPSRLDRIVEIDMPTKKMRKEYIENKSLELKNTDIDKLIKDTKDFSFAHIKELIISVEVYKISYDEALIRIKKMRKKQLSSNKWQKKLNGTNSEGYVGFGG